jgi:hypothetical protein
MKKQRTVKIVQNQGVPLIANKLRPNDKCPCKSGKKLKNCHKIETRYYFSKEPIRNYDNVSS